MHIFIDLPQFKFVRKNTPYPAHRDCAHLMIEKNDYQNWIMVHGFIVKNGKFKGYAWLERAGKVFDVRAKKTMTKKEFYSQNKPVNVLLYEYKEVRVNMRKFRRYGRWAA